MTAPIGILFVCTHNICRSPMAQAVLATKAARAGIAGRLRIDSAGTSTANAGRRVDARAMSVAARRGYDIAPRRPRSVVARDFARFDHVLAMDEGNLRALQAVQPPGYTGRIALLLSLTPSCALREVPDPYFGSLANFDRVLDLIEPAADALLRDLQSQ